MSKRRPYRRPIAANWWAKPPYRAYTTRELSGVAVATYGGVVFAGLVSLFRGPEAYESFLRFLASPVSLGLHVLLLAAVLFHVVTWFQTLPKTMPHLVLGGEPVPAATITRVATLAATASSLALILFTLWVSR